MDYGSHLKKIIKNPIIVITNISQYVGVNVNFKLRMQGGKHNRFPIRTRRATSPNFWSICKPDAEGWAFNC